LRHANLNGPQAGKSMQIYLLRHGIAENARPGQPDSERALTDEGREKLRRVLKRAQAAPDAILSSPYKRALETAAVAAEALGYKNEIERTRALVPEASPYDAWEEIRGRRADASILLASHEPLMSSLAAFLLGCPALQVDMKKAALLRIDCDRMGTQPRGVLKWMLTPATAGE
jgi:phosphohistidine phosphatase